jgi:uncharacterized membrane protein
MTFDIVFLRLLHIIFGSYWVGAAIFFALILEPRTRALASDVRRPVMAAVGRAMGPSLTVSAVISILAGLALVLRLRWGDLGGLFESGWGWAILAGFLASLAALVFNGLSGMSMARLGRLEAALQGRRPMGEAAVRLEALRRRMRSTAQGAAALLVVTVAAMAVARFV